MIANVYFPLGKTEAMLQVGPVFRFAFGFESGFISVV